MLSRFLYVIIAFVSASHLAQVSISTIKTKGSAGGANMVKILLFLVQCRPMAAIWNPQIQGQCFSSHFTYLAGYIGFGKIGLDLS